MKRGYIKIYRSLLDWEWYSDIYTTRLALHLLLKAKHRPEIYQGIELERGQLCTGRKLLAKQTGLTESQVRTHLERLIECDFINSKTTNKYSIITICNYDSYQGLQVDESPTRPSATPTNRQQKPQQIANKTTSKNSDVNNCNSDDYQPQETSESPTESPTNNQPEPQQIATFKEYKEIKNNIPPISPKGEVVSPTWREDFEIYKKELLQAYVNAINSQTWIAQREVYQPTLDIPLTLQKAVYDFWITESGWKRKKSSKKTKNIDWLTTFNTALTLPSNKVYKNNNHQNNHQNNEITRPY